MHTRSVRSACDHRGTRSGKHRGRRNWADIRDRNLVTNLRVHENIQRIFHVKNSPVVQAIPCYCHTRPSHAYDSAWIHRSDVAAAGLEAGRCCGGSDRAFDCCSCCYCSVGSDPRAFSFDFLDLKFNGKEKGGVNYDDLEISRKGENNSKLAVKNEKCNKTLKNFGNTHSYHDRS